MKANLRKTSHRVNDATEPALRRLINSPETAHLIFEFAESLYLRDETAKRMTLSDIKQIGEYLKQTETDLNVMKKQFQDLAEIEGGFQTDVIPTGF